MQIPKQNLNRQSTQAELNVSSESLPGRRLDASDLGLQFITTEGQGWPDNMPAEDLIRGIHNKKYKRIYTSRSYSGERVLRKTFK